MENQKGRVLISLVQSEKYAVISIVDDGKGMPPELLKVLGVRGGTFGKPSGSGLGLHHAIKTVELWGGYLKFESTPGLGTTVKIMLPLAKSASWFVECLHVPVNSKIIILDDDINIHQIWFSRFEKMRASDQGVEFLSFSMPDQLSLWVNSNKGALNNSLFLIDYEFLGSDQVGLDLIQYLGIKSQSILITSHYEERDLRARCESLGVQLIPKDMAALVPIHIRTERMVDAILIDDDPLIRAAWDMDAKAKQKILVSFSTAEAFTKIASTFFKKTPIYIDVSLANGVRGEDVAAGIFELGFLNIYLATGYNPEKFSHLTFLRGVIGKYSPF
ncbi:MAG TPA: ATP-binding protein [Gammaproteobacteria bacterium]|jgi:hypothetical protein|nr:ATP-binding protein [Gammaproteobacteria bacterium]